MQASLFTETRRDPRNPFGASLSFLLHGAALAWVAVLPAAGPAGKPKSAYDELIKPHEKKLVWYRFSERLPETTPETKSSGPAQAQTKAKQNVVARGARGAEQTIWQPVPKIDLPKELPSPNIVAMRTPQAPPPPDRPKPKMFNPPREALREAIPDLLSDAPDLDVRSKTEVAGLDRGLADALKNRPRFVPPPEAARPRPADPQLPQAPEVRVASAGNVPTLEQGLQDALRNKPQPKKFVPPVSRQAEARPAELGPAPAVRAGGAAPVPTLGQGVNEALKNRPRFVPPPERPRTAAAPTMIPQAPGVQVAANSSVPMMGNDVRDALNNRPRAKAFRPPPYKRVEPLPPVLEEAPAMLASTARGDVNAAIVGLRPAPRLDAPLPDGSRLAEFSAGPKLSVEGGEPQSRAAMLSVPGIAIGEGAAKAAEPAEPVLVARAAPTSTQNLLAAARTAPMPATIQQGDTTALRVATAPDGQFSGRAVYTLSVQMPNITSYYGSWMLWFSERDPSQKAGLQPPAPLRKVDPRYVPSAVEEKIEGIVRLSAVIRQDGSLGDIVVVRSLDSRLDFAAREALSKWIFEPAMRDGAPIDVDAVIEVPFRLAPPELRYK
jgi:TonB family protein